ncbi:MAG: tRNA uridine-5-carboxymethylaminomethyl(34) synthesis GTPase MnmE [Armatimonadota bacterium]|nr:tRNA uridine-5-carboxymethylaminomethyl(34) synthesis GTPase MnmE [bacterium]MCS7309215.1 tRNA uridine-5-carboxymethylaminomethyl(34) synthesis GTPase MnmE [Armatimonadota bacterium]MDW8103972.1 tRNA uridine-5-carboxymethylaminomethyl(34) synthesis GTPase MnmE [Armatimonadota bacterium]MDW8290315.1 tRNA uridine-5-carboxymethylaminomethyl(34) synthesis GTPase MnmE [Armatimonadota bacterium]
MFASEDTIAAIATPPGEGGVGIVRVSGTRAWEIARRLFQPLPAPLESHRVYVGWIVAPDSGERIDRALLLTFRAPRSYTGEDVVEFSCHGGMVLLRRVLRLTLQHGARLAQPGEFTLRAFLNGRLDLAQAEAVADLVRARTESAQRLAARQHEGELSRAIHALREALIALLAQVEAHLDFSDDVGEMDYAHLQEQIRHLIARCQSLLATARYGRLTREGATVVLAGRPNVGKSSLMNALLGEERAIVTDIPGTTRDVIKESLQIEGIPVQLWDTAGLRETADIVERFGVERTHRSLQQADLILYLLSAPDGYTPEDQQLLARLPSERTLLVWNKCDLLPEGKRAQLLQQASPAVFVSALTGWNLSQLREAIGEKLLGSDWTTPEGAIVTSERHQLALQGAVESLQQALQSAEEALPAELVSVDLRGALDALGLITGETVTEDIVERIFSDFCIGK